VDAVIEHSRAKGAAYVVALIIAKYVNDDSGRAWPSVTTIAQKARVSRQTVLTSIDWLVGAGELAVTPGGRGPGHRSQYEILVKSAPTAPAREDSAGDGMANAHAKRVRKPNRQRDPHTSFADEQLIPAYPEGHRGTRKWVLAALRDLNLDDAGRTALLARLEAWKSSQEWVVRGFTPSLEKFLRDDRYKYDPKRKPDSQRKSWSAEELWDGRTTEKH
jgi:hypothetical protein